VSNECVKPDRQCDGVVINSRWRPLLESQWFSGNLEKSRSVNVVRYSGQTYLLEEPPSNNQTAGGERYPRGRAELIAPRGKGAISG
jgi:hypothetical protein